MYSYVLGVKTTYTFWFYLKKYVLIKIIIGFQRKYFMMYKVLVFEMSCEHISALFF